MITQSSLGFHTSYLSGAKNEFSRFLKNIEINNPQYAVISNVDANAYTDPEQIRSNLVSHFDTAVLVEKSLVFSLDRWGLRSPSNRGSDQIEVIDIGSSGFMSKCVKESIVEPGLVNDIAMSYRQIDSTFKI